MSLTCDQESIALAENRQKRGDGDGQTQRRASNFFKFAIQIYERPLPFLSPSLPRLSWVMPATNRSIHAQTCQGERKVRLPWSSIATCCTILMRWSQRSRLRNLADLKSILATDRFDLGIVELKKAFQILSEQPRPIREVLGFGARPRWTTGLPKSQASLTLQILPVIRDACDNLRGKPGNVALVSKIILRNWEEIMHCLEDLVFGGEETEPDDMHSTHHLVMTTLIILLSFHHNLSTALLHHEMTVPTIATSWAVVARFAPSILDPDYAEGCVVVNALTLTLSQDAGTRGLVNYWLETDWGTRKALVDAASYRLRDIGRDIGSYLATGHATVYGAAKDTLTLIMLFELVTLDGSEAQGGWGLIHDAKGVFHAFSALSQLALHPLGCDSRCQSQIAVLAHRLLDWIHSFPEPTAVAGLRSAIQGGALAVLSKTNSITGLVVPQYKHDNALSHLFNIHSYLEDLSIARPVARALRRIILDPSTDPQFAAEWDWIRQAAARMGRSRTTTNVLMFCYNGCVRLVSYPPDTYN